MKKCNKIMVKSLLAIKPLEALNKQICDLVDNFKLILYVFENKLGTSTRKNSEKFMLIDD